MRALILDSEGVSKLIARDRGLNEWLSAARAEDTPVIASAVTLVEAVAPKSDVRAADYALSRIRVVNATAAHAKVATGLLRKAGLHGHRYALDALVAATALAAGGGVVLTSDPDDLAALLDGQPAVRVVKI